MPKAPLMLLAALVVAVSAPAHAAFSLARTAFSGGGVAVSGGSYTLGATVGEAGVVGRVGGGSYTLAEGFWTNVIAITATDVADLGPGAEVWVNRLRSNFPNPFRSSTSIAYTVGRESPVRLSVYDIAGRRVSSLVDAPQTPGQYLVQWRGLDELGSPVASGVYMIRLDVGSWSETRKTLKIR
jgi:hypothetical protein